MFNTEITIRRLLCFYGIKKRTDLFFLGTRSWIDAIHHCAHHAPSIELTAVEQQLDDNGLANRPESLMALPSALEVLALSCCYKGYDPMKNAFPSASDFEAPKSCVAWI